MILLTDSMISKIDRMRLFQRMNTICRSVFIIGILCITFYAVYTEQHDYFIYPIVCMLISTYLINLIGDSRRNNLEEILRLIDYERCKKKHEDA